MLYTFFIKNVPDETKSNAMAMILFHREDRISTIGRIDTIDRKPP